MHIFSKQTLVIFIITVNDTDSGKRKQTVDYQVKSSGAFANIKIANVLLLDAFW